MPSKTNSFLLKGRCEMLRRKNEEKKKLAQFWTCARVRDGKRKRRECRKMCETGAEGERMPETR